MASAQRLAVLASITPPSKGSELVPRCMPITRIRKNRQCYFRKPSQFTRMKCGLSYYLCTMRLSVMCILGYSVLFLHKSRDRPPLYRKLSLP